MTERARVCLDLTPSETQDRFGGFTRYGLALLEHLLALPAAERADLDLWVLARSDAAPVPAETVVPAVLLSAPVVPIERHGEQRRRLTGPALRAARVDLFHALHPESLPWRCGCPVVATVADIICEVLPQPGETGFRRWKNSIRHYLRHVRPDHLISISGTTRDDLQRVMHIGAARVDVVPLGVDTARFALEADAAGGPDLQPLGLPERYFIAVGSDHYRKNQETLYRAWKQAAASLPEGLVLVGRQIYGDTFERIREDASTAGLGERLFWLGDLGDDYLPALYRRASALVAPSQYEGFGMTLLEAMACGAPVLASAVPAHREVAGDAALLFDPRNVADLAGLLVRVSADEAARRRLRRLGLERVQGFTWERCARETLRVYRKVLGVPPRP